MRFLCRQGGLLFDAEAERFVGRYHDDVTRNLLSEGHRLGVPNLMNYIMDCRLVQSLLSGQEPDISVCDAALWSSVAELSERSATQGGRLVPVPDFTRGNWQ